MIKITPVLTQLILLISLLLTAATNAGATNIPMYKGVLTVLKVAGYEGDTLLLQYHTKTRQVLRVGVRGLTITNRRTQRVTRLPDASANLAAEPRAGELVADIEYDGLKLADDDYRVEGNMTVYLAGMQQSRNFRVYLKPRRNGRPANSGIDWGLDSPAR